MKKGAAAKIRRPLMESTAVVRGRHAFSIRKNTITRKMEMLE